MGDTDNMPTLSNFSGGMNLLIDSSLLSQNEYALAFNVRNRNGVLEPILGPKEDTTAPAGKKQGIYAFDKYLLIFVAGKAYYKDVTNVNSIWTQIVGFQMNPLVDYIYTQAVPASTINYQRNLADITQVSGNSATSPVNVTSIQVNGTQGGLVVQDGINQPWVIFPDATARVIQTYAEWSKIKREYVPVGKQMAYVNGILLVTSPDGKQIYRSVSGRPLDFVVNVNINGDKGGDAETTSYAVGLNSITYLGGMNTGELLVGTGDISYPIEFDYNNTIFGEPRFLNRKSFQAGIVNQFSVSSVFRSDGYSDYYFIDRDGIRSFSSAAGDQSEGRNSSFAGKINKGLAAKQTLCCAAAFDNYTLFSVKSIYDDDKNYIAVFDNISLTWVCFDYHSTDSIKQFAVATQYDSPRLYAITDNKVYHIFGSDDYALADVRFPSVSSGLASVQIKLNDLWTVFIDSNSVGTISATIYADGSFNSTIKGQLRGKVTENLKFNFQGQSLQCWRVQPRIQWQNSNKLLLVEYNTSLQTQNIPV